MSNDLVVLTNQPINRLELEEMLISLGGSCEDAYRNQIGQLDENREAVWVNINGGDRSIYWDVYATRLEGLGWHFIGTVIVLEASSEGAFIAFKLLNAIAERFGPVFAISEMAIPDDLPAHIHIVEIELPPFNPGSA